MFTWYGAVGNKPAVIRCPTTAAKKDIDLVAAEE